MLIRTDTHTMELSASGQALGHLTYCSNIHAGESWAEVNANLRQHVPGIRDALGVQGSFGIGLRLSAAATRELAEPEAMKALLAFLEAERCYVFTLNGFPYGPFHGTRVKEEVYLPDWQDAERLRYTDQLADVMAALLPEADEEHRSGDGPRTTHGSISTVPGAFKARVTDADGIAKMTHNLVAHAAHLARIEQRTGKLIVLALEPEPCCFLETIEESVAFFRDHLFGEAATRQLVDALDVDSDTAAALLRRHLTLCLDLCHAAIEFEDCNDCFDTLNEAGIAIGKLQISAGLKLENVTAASAEALLRPYVDEVYLHQVVERHQGVLTRFTDLPEALASLPADDGPGGSEREWRVHFHVPVFMDDLGEFSSTQSFIREALARHRHAPLSTHLEVETYTWDVLPPQLRERGIDDAIISELAWVRDEILGA